MQVVEIWMFTGKTSPAALRGRKQTRCPGRTRTLTGGTRIRSATITPLDKSCFFFCKCSGKFLNGKQSLAKL